MCICQCRYGCRQNSSAIATIQLSFSFVSMVTVKCQDSKSVHSLQFVKDLTVPISIVLLVCVVNGVTLTNVRKFI